MKRFKIPAFVLVAVSSLFFTACDNDDDDVANVTPQPTKTELLTRAEWKGSDFLLDGISHKDSSWIGIADFRLKFNSNGTSVMRDLDGDTATINWKFINNETQLVLDGDTNNIKILTMDNLNLESTEPRPANTPAEYEIRLVH